MTYQAPEGTTVKVERNQWFLSSTGSGDLSLTIKGLLVALVPLIIAAFQAKGIEVTQTQLMEAIEGLFAAVSAVAIAWGLIRKLLPK